MFPQIAVSGASNLAVIRSMTSKANERAPADDSLHTGSPVTGFPSARAWVNCGQRTVNHELPGFVALQSPASRLQSPA